MARNAVAVGGRHQSRLALTSSQKVVQVIGHHHHSGRHVGIRGVNGILGSTGSRASEAAFGACILGALAARGWEEKGEDRVGCTMACQ